MAGRIRSIKPEWLEDELLSAASGDARTLSVGLLLLSDDHGRGRAHPATIGAAVFALCRVNGEVVEREDSTDVARRALDELAAIGFVRLYTVRGQKYFEVRNWKKHQRVDKPSPPRVPGPEEAGEPFANDSRGPREDLASEPGPARESFAPDPDPDPDPDHDPPGSGVAGPVNGETHRGVVVADTPTLRPGVDPDLATDTDKCLAELERISLLVGDVGAAETARRMAQSADARGNGRRPMAPYVADAVDRFALKVREPTNKPWTASGALGWLKTTAEGGWLQRKPVAGLEEAS